PNAPCLPRPPRWRPAAPWRPETALRSAFGRFGRRPRGPVRGGSAARTDAQLRPDDDGPVPALRPRRGRTHPPRNRGARDHRAVRPRNPSRGGSIMTWNFRITVRGRFSGLDEDQRRSRRAAQDVHDMLSSRFSTEGTFL